MSIRRLRKMIDFSLVTRMKNGWRAKDDVKPLKRVLLDPRPSYSYRAARRNAARGTVWKADGGAR